MLESFLIKLHTFFYRTPPGDWFWMLMLFFVPVLFLLALNKEPSHKYGKYFSSLFLEMHECSSTSFGS